MRTLVSDMHGKQDGDPAKAARALDLALKSDKTPLRLQVGANSIAAVRAHAEHLLKELATWEKVGADIRVDANGSEAAWHEPLDLAKRGGAAA